MSEKREGFLGKQEAQAQRSLENLTRRWPTNPNTFYSLLIAVLLVILLIALP